MRCKMKETKLLGRPIQILLIILIFEIVILFFGLFKTEIYSGENEIDSNQYGVIYSYEDALRDVYDAFIMQIEKTDDLSIMDICPSFEDFCRGYNSSNASIKEYLASLEYNISYAMEAENKEYDVTAYNPQVYASMAPYYVLINDGLQAEPEYYGKNLNNFLAALEEGNLVYEEYAWTKHIAIIEGEIVIPSWGIYVGTIEAVSVGVSRGFIDINRMIDYKCSILSVNATSKQKQDAVEFCQGQVGKDYSVNFVKQEYAYNTKSWYCSELVWAAYYNQGINLDRNPVFNGILPKTISDSNLTNNIFAWTQL